MTEFKSLQVLKDLSLGDYDVHVAVLTIDGKDDLPQYAIVNRTTGVIEFTQSNLFYVKDWLKTFLSPDNKEATADVIPFLSRN